MKYTDSKELMSKLMWLVNRIEGYQSTKAMADCNSRTGELARDSLAWREDELNQLIDELALTLPTIQALVRMYGRQKKPAEGGDSNG